MSLSAPRFPYESTTKSSRNSSWCGWGSSKNGKDDQAADCASQSKRAAFPFQSIGKLTTV
eukprot:5455008-Amphidinium_carterae.1